jgi:hypothetical protein
MGASLNCYTYAGGDQILENWGKAEPKRYYGVMVEAVNHSRLHPTSMLNVFRVFEHLHILWMGIWALPFTHLSMQVGSYLCWKLGYDGDQMTWFHF